MSETIERVPRSAVHHDEAGEPLAEPVVEYEDRVAHGTHHVAFRCKACGHLERPEAAGECDRPHAGPVCGAGVIFRHKKLAAQLEEGIKAGADPKKLLQLVAQVAACDPSSKDLHAENWECLHDCQDERLEE